jgi:hypothetical protein
MNKKIPVGMLGFFVGVLAVYLLISAASSGYDFGKSLAQDHKRESERSTSASN